MQDAPYTHTQTCLPEQWNHFRVISNVMKLLLTEKKKKKILNTPGIISFQWNAEITSSEKFPRKYDFTSIQYSVILRIAMNRKTPLPKSMHKWQHAVNAVWRGDKKPDSGSNLHKTKRTGSLLWMRKWQWPTPDNYRGHADRSPPEIKYKHTVHQFQVVQDLFSTPNVTTTLQVFCKPTVPRTNMEVVVIFIVTAVFLRGQFNCTVVWFPLAFKEKYSFHTPTPPIFKCIHVHLYSSYFRNGEKNIAIHFSSFHMVAYLLWAEFAAACITAAAASCALRFTVGMGGPIPGPPCWDMPGELGVILLMFPGNGLLCIPADGIRPRGMVPQGWLGPCPCIWLLAFIPMPGPGPL